MCNQPHPQIGSNLLDVPINLHRLVRESQPGNNEPLFLQLLQLAHDTHVFVSQVFAPRTPDRAVAVFPLDLRVVTKNIGRVYD